MNHFFGEIEELKEIVKKASFIGEWKEKGQSMQFRSTTGREIINWWPSKGTVQFQGKNSKNLEEKIVPFLNTTNNTTSKIKTTSKKQIFIVHGHDLDARDQLDLVIRKFELETFILQNSDGGTKTIIEALEQNIYQESAFGIVLLTPDDFGYSKKNSDTERQPRARQNVILEMGMVMAALGREKMTIIQKGTLERPSDTDGILLIKYNDHIREVIPKLAQRLQSAGFTIDPNNIAKASV